MAIIKDLTVLGPSRFISDIYGNTAYANKFITNGGLSTQFVKGDGTLDSSQYITSESVGNTYLTKSVAETTYLKQTVAETSYAKRSYIHTELAKYLSKSTAETTYLKQTVAETSYAKKSHGHGELTNDGKLTKANRAVMTDSNLSLTVSPITSTELEYLDNARSNIQDQIDNLSNSIATGVIFKGTWNNGTLPETASSSTVGHMWTYIGAGIFNLAEVTNGNDAEVLRKGDAIIGVNNGATYYWCAIDNNADIATASIPGLVKKGTTSNTTMGVDVAADGAMTVDHYDPENTQIQLNNASYYNGTYTASGLAGTPLSAGSGIVITGLKWHSDKNGHVTKISYTLGKLPADGNAVTITATSGSANYPMVFKNSTGATTVTEGLRCDSEAGSLYYNPSLNKFYAKKTYTDYVSLPVTSDATDETVGINFYNNGNIAHIGGNTASLLGLYSDGKIVLRPNGATSSGTGNGSVEISYDGVLVSEALTVESLNSTGYVQAATALKRSGQHALTIANALVADQIITANAASSGNSYVGKSSGYTIATTLTNTSTTQVPTSKAINDYIAGRSYITSSSIPYNFKTITPGANSTSTGAGTANTTSVVADTTTDTLTVSPGNKWITTGGDATNDVVYINHAAIGAVTPITSANTVTASASGATAAWSIDVVKGVTITYDNAGHVTGLSVTSGKIPPAPTDNNDKVKVYGLSDNKAHSLLFKYEGGANASTSGDAANYVGSDSDGITNAYYNPSTNTLYGTNIIGSAVTGVSTLKRGTEHAVTTSDSWTASDNIVTTSGTYKAKSSGKTIAYMLDASHMIITYGGVTANLADTIIENEEVTAAALNDLDVRIQNINASIPYGTIGTAGSTAAKTVDAPGFKLYTGAVINVRFTYRNTADSPTLNVNSLGAKNIFYNGSAIGSTDAKYLLHEQITLIYDGVQFNISSANAKKSIELEVYDDRTVSDAPYAFPKSISAHFKANGTNGLSKGFSTVMQIVGWGSGGTDTSGGPAHELAFAQTNGEIWHRYSSNATTWNSWTQVLESSNVNLTSSASGTSNTVTLSYGPNSKSVTLEHYTPSTASTVVGPPAGTPATKTLAHSGNFAVPRISFDSKGHIVLGETITYTLPASGNTDVKVSFTSSSDNYNYPLIFKYTADTATGANYVRFDSQGTSAAYYNPSANRLFSPIVAGTTSYFVSSYMGKGWVNGRLDVNGSSYVKGREVVAFDIINSTMTDLSLF